jgi:hypothetical protein
MKIEDLSEGDTIQVGSGFGCVEDFSQHVLRRDHQHGLYFQCATGQHFLDGLEASDGHLKNVVFVKSSQLEEWRHSMPDKEIAQKLIDLEDLCDEDGEPPDRIEASAYDWYYLLTQVRKLRKALELSYGGIDNLEKDVKGCLELQVSDKSHWGVGTNVFAMKKALEALKS